MKCSEVMTKNPQCCLPTTTVNKVAQMMEHDDIGPVPVVQDMESKRLAGIVTDRDLTLKVVAKGLDPKTTQVREIMSNSLVTCRPDDTVDQAIARMEDNMVRRVLVTDNNNKLLGIITVSDVVTRVSDPQKTTKMVENLSCCH